MPGEARATKTFSAGVYQIRIASSFNSDQPIRSVDFVFVDGNLDSDTHVRSYPVGTDNPGVLTTYRLSFEDQWTTHENGVVVGSGNFDITKYDRAAKLLSGTFDMMVKQGSKEKHIAGGIVDMPMETAE